MEFEVQSTFKRQTNPSWKYVWGVMPMVVLQRQKVLYAGWGNPMPLATHPGVSGCPPGCGASQATGHESLLHQLLDV